MTADEIKDILSIVALLAIAYNVGDKLSGMSVAIRHLTSAVERLASYPERLAVVETTLEDHEGRLTRAGM